MTITNLRSTPASEAGAVQRCFGSHAMASSSINVNQMVLFPELPHVRAFLIVLPNRVELGDGKRDVFEVVIEMGLVDSQLANQVAGRRLRILVQESLGVVQNS